MFKFKLFLPASAVARGGGTGSGDATSCGIHSDTHPMIPVSVETAMMELSYTLTDFPSAQQ